MDEREPTAADDLDVVLLAGGSGTRLGGQDKAELEVGGQRLIDRAVVALAPAMSAGSTLVIVGPQRALDPAPALGIRWTRETPPGGGPLAATAAGLRLVGAPLVAVLAVDLPFVSWAAVHRLAVVLVAQPSAPGALYVDATGHDQLLFGVWRTTRLRAALPSEPHGKPMRLLAGPNVLRVGLPTSSRCSTAIPSATSTGRGSSQPPARRPHASQEARREHAGRLAGRGGA